MAFDTLQGKVVEGLLSFTNTIGHRSTGASSTWRGRKERSRRVNEQFKTSPATLSYKGDILFL